MADGVGPVVREPPGDDLVVGREQVVVAVALATLRGPEPPAKDPVPLPPRTPGPGRLARVARDECVSTRQPVRLVAWVEVVPD